MDLTPGSLFASLIVGSIGFGIFLYGRKQSRLPQLLTGLALMTYPYFVASVAWMLGIAGVLLVGLTLAVRAGL
jgi:hypothetical protein